MGQQKLAYASQGVVPRPVRLGLFPVWRALVLPPLVVALVLVRFLGPVVAFVIVLGLRAGAHPTCPPAELVNRGGVPARAPRAACRTTACVRALAASSRSSAITPRTTSSMGRACSSDSYHRARAANSGPV